MPLTPELAAFLEGQPGSTPEARAQAGLGILERRLTTLLLLTAELGAQGPPNGLPGWVVDLGMSLGKIPEAYRRECTLKLTRVGLAKLSVAAALLSHAADQTDARRLLDLAADLSEADLTRAYVAQQDAIKDSLVAETLLQGRELRILHSFDEIPTRPKRPYRRRKRRRTRKGQEHVDSGP